MADSDPPRRPTWLVFYVFPILSGLLLGASHVPLPTGFLAYVGLIPLLLSVAVLSGRSAFIAGFIHGIFYYAATIYWIAWITPPGVLAAVFYLSLWRGLSLTTRSPGPWEEASAPSRRKRRWPKLSRR